MVTAHSGGYTFETWPVSGGLAAVSGAERPDLALAEEFPGGNAVADLTQTTDEHCEIGLHSSIPTQIHRSEGY